MIRPNISYWVGSTLYINVTKRASSLIPWAIPGKDTGFIPLQSDDEEPTALEIMETVDAAYTNDERKRIIGMGENDEGVCFAGHGEPLLKLDTIVESSQMIRERRHGVPFRLRTTGLVPDGDVERAVNELVNAKIRSIDVFVPAADPKSFEQIMKPESPSLHFGTVCEFITLLAAQGATVECFAPRDTTKFNDIRQLCTALGAVDTRKLE